MTKQCDKLTPPRGGGAFAIEQSASFAGQFLQLAFSAAPTAIVMLDEKLKVLRANPAFKTLLGLQDSDLAKYSYPQLTGGDDAVKLTQRFQALAAGTHPAGQRKISCRHRQGGRVWVLESVAVLQDPAVPVRFIVQLADISQQHAEQQRWRHLAHHDPLTNLPNRRWLENRLNKELAQIAAGGPGGALLLVDLDGFKQINDNFGHHFGDYTLKSLAALLQASLQSDYVVARHGGDEFAILLPGAPVEKAEEICRRLQMLFATNTIVMAGYNTQISACIGVALYPADGTTVAGVLKKADEAMYKAKQKGLNQYCCSACG